MSNVKKKESKISTPEDWGVTTWYRSLGIRIPRTSWGRGLDHALIVHFDELIFDV